MSHTRLERATQWINLIQGIAVIAGLVFAGYQLRELVIQNKIQSDTLKTTQLAESANLTLQLENEPGSSKYNDILTAIQDNPQTYPILDIKDGGKSGQFTSDDVEGYLGDFEDIGIMVRNNVLLPDMAYDDFAYEFEKTWCNNDIQYVINNDRKLDRDLTKPNRFWDNFEYLSKIFFQKDNKTCADMDKE